jgi:CheY-like chemotaxis protein
MIKVLLAEDDLDDRFFFRKALAEMPIVTHLTCVFNGEQLMEHLAENAENFPDILFLDLSMPRKNGFECLSEIMENHKMQHLHVVMFSTSYTRDSNYEKAMIDMLIKIGAKDFIRKPTDFEQLKQVVYEVLVGLRK